MKITDMFGNDLTKTDSFGTATREKIKMMKQTEKYAQNILKVFNRARADEISLGIHWYEDAAKECRTISKIYGIKFETVCEVMAALSPNNKWGRNIRDTWRLIEGWKSDQRSNVVVCTYNRNKQKAFDILDGTGELSGIKVTNFARNIAGCEESVTVDGHALSVAFGERYVMKRASKKATPKVYAEIADGYRQVAANMGIEARQLQAITWSTWRRLVQTKEQAN